MIRSGLIRHLPHNTSPYRSPVPSVFEESFSELDSAMQGEASVQSAVERLQHEIPSMRTALFNSAWSYQEKSQICELGSKSQFIYFRLYF